MSVLPQRFVKFGLVGGIGFLVDAGTLAFLVNITPFDAFSARLIAIALALCVTWFLNRTLTFDASGHSMGAEAVRYGGVGIAGSVLNYAIYSAIVLATPRVGALTALFLASAAVMVLSYLGYSRLVFRAK